MSFLESIIAILIFVNICYLIARLRNDNSIMTAGWPIGILIVELVWFLNLDEILDIHWVVLGMSLLWALRLFIHALLRNLRRGYEDFRYSISGERKHLISYFQFFIVQGFFMIIIGLPFAGINQGEPMIPQIQLVIGVLVFIVGLVIETIADIQLTRFKRSNANDAVLRTGLWSRSRHPNYLGEILVWYGIGIVTFQIETWWIVISPIIVTLLLRYISGVPLLDKRYEDNVEYQEYKKQVNTIFPI